MDDSGTELKDAIDEDEDLRVLRFFDFEIVSFHGERSKIRKCELWSE